MKWKTRNVKAKKTIVSFDEAGWYELDVEVDVGLDEAGLYEIKRRQLGVEHL